MGVAGCGATADDVLWLWKAIVCGGARMPDLWICASKRWRRGRYEKKWGFES